MSAYEAVHNEALFPIEPRTLKGKEITPPSADMAKLTRALARGDEAAWIHFHEQYSGRIYRYLLVLLRGNHDLAVELLQVTFTRVARHIRVFHQEKILWHWLARIARTAVIDELRKTEHRDNLMNAVASATDATTDPEEYCHELLGEALAQLEQDYRDLLSGKYIEGLSIRELASASGDSEKAVESRLVRARQKLREIMLILLRREA